MILIGFFGKPGTTGGKIHACRECQELFPKDLRPKPLCGSRLSAKAEFQWCATFPSGTRFVECKHCKKKMKGVLKQWLDEEIKGKPREMGNPPWR